ncbi:MAG: hypothetical protein IPM06_21630 [Rhizobiales bacterium]|nr:hypothetical protein [Hyphomicrobiales bacterium]
MAMTQSTRPAGAQVGPLLFASASGTIPATGNTVLLEVPTLGLKNIGVDFDVGVNALDTFVVSAQFHPDGAFQTLYSAITSTPAGLIIAASGTLASTGAGATAWLLMDVRGIYKVRFSASGTAADTTTVAIRCSGSR